MQVVCGVCKSLRCVQVVTVCASRRWCVQVVCCVCKSYVVFESRMWCLKVTGRGLDRGPKIDRVTQPFLKFDRGHQA